MPWIQKDRSRRLAIWVCSFAFAFLGAQSVAHAKIVLDPSSGSHFELVRKTLDFEGKFPTVWRDARPAAEKRVHKGIRGRLAVIKSQDTLIFLQKNFDISISWIGLRYFCANKKLVWVNGDTLKPEADFQRWHPKWARTHIRCSNRGYMPIYLTDATSSLSWQASGPEKGFQAYLVEYPAPK